VRGQEKKCVRIACALSSSKTKGYPEISALCGVVWRSRSKLDEKNVCGETVAYSHTYSSANFRTK
jgi:hypothetical protein